MNVLRRLYAAVRRRVRGPYRSIGRLDARVAEVQSRMAGLESAVTELRWAVDRVEATTGESRQLGAATHELLGGEIKSVLRALAAEEPANRRRLYRLRAERDYEAAWVQRTPLVSVTIATRDRPELLCTRSLPSVLGQTYGELEVIVVGDHAEEQTAEAVRSLGDPRVSYHNLTQRLHHTDDPRRAWLVAATMARNEATRVARGRWIVCFDDDDAMRPEMIERLLELAREQRLEAVYGRAMVHREGESEFEIGVFPPELGRFTWASGMYHAGLRFLEREIFAADLDVPGDWFLAERMLRAGVRFGMLDAVLCDMHPSPMNRPARD